jgi:hypothetical protein
MYAHVNPKTNEQANLISDEVNQIVVEVMRHMHNSAVTLPVAVLLGFMFSIRRSSSYLSDQLMKPTVHDNIDPSLSLHLL